MNNKEKSIILVSAYTANGDLVKLKSAMAYGLDMGLTVNEIKEIFAHLYAYVGFPRALNAQGLFMKLVAERAEEGIVDNDGRQASEIADFDKDKYGAETRAKLAGLDEVPPDAEWQKFNPVMDKFLKEHLFADIFSRDIFTHKERELITISALASLIGTEGQLKYHVTGAMNMGYVKEELADFAQILKDNLGEREGEIASKIIDEVFSDIAQA